MPKHTLIAYFTLPMRLWARGLEMALRGFVPPASNESSAATRGLPWGWRPVPVPIRCERDRGRL
jgi:hypothetical protein